MIDFRFFLFFALLALISCSTPQQASTQQVTVNGLSPADKAVGWQSLFNGNDMNQWRVFNETTVRGWKVENEIMTALGIQGKSADIITKDTFSDFELSLEWKIAEGGNSGIFFHVREGEGLKAVYYSGPEYQLLDDQAYEGKITDKQKSAANYDMQAPSIDATKPAGQWNHSRLIVDGDHVQHWLNGKKVVSYIINSTEWKTQKINSKWKHVETYAKFPSGHIALQDHGKQISFRNIKVRRL